MGDCYEYYIWSDPEDSDDDLKFRIEEALRDANLQYEFNGLEQS